MAIRISHLKTSYIKYKLVPNNEYKIIPADRHIIGTSSELIFRQGKHILITMQTQTNLSFKVKMNHVQWLHSLVNTMQLKILKFTVDIQRIHCSQKKYL